jgi:hypothetical protein
MGGSELFPLVIFVTHWLFSQKCIGLDAKRRRPPYANAASSRPICLEVEAQPKLHTPRRMRAVQVQEIGIPEAAA